LRFNSKSLRAEGEADSTPASWRVALAVLAIALALGLGSAIRPVWTIDPDASLYLGLGRALAAGEGYVLDGQPHTKYPPGFPALLGVLVRVGGPEAYRLFHAALVAGLVLASLASWKLARRLGYPRPVAYAVAAAFGVSTTLFDLSVVYLRSEVPFLLLTYLALMAFWPSRRTSAPPRIGPVSVAGAAVAVVAAIAVRLAGVALLAIPVLRWRRRPTLAGARRQATLALVAGALAVLAWQSWTTRALAQHPEAAAYGAEFTAAEPRDLTKIVRADMPPLDGPALARRVVGNAEVLARATAVLLTNVDRAAARLPVGVLLLALVLLGLLAMWRAGGARAEAVAYVAATLLLYLLWPFNQQERFYAPLLPLLLLAAGEGAVCLWALAGRWVGSRAGRLSLLAAGAALLALLALQRSDHPVVLGRWSLSYLGLLLAASGLLVVAWRLVRHGRLPAPRPTWALALPALVAVPWLHKRGVEWPARVAEFEARRSAEPQTGALARIDCDPRLEQIAVFLRDRTPPDTLVMTDVPAMLQTLCERRCIPFVYQVQPPDVLTGEADLLFYSREWPDAAAVTDAVASRWKVVLALEPVFDGERMVVPTVYELR
jgi:hypothetical protein